MSVCIGRYCECRYHLNPDIPAWSIENYTPSPWAQEVLHAMWLEGRTVPTEHEQAVAWVEIANLAEKAQKALREGVTPDGL